MTGSRLAAAALGALLAAPLPAEVIAITGATVHTVGPAGTLERATILIEDGRVAALGADLKVPDGARRIDAAGRVVTPGLMTPMGQIGLVEVDAVAETVDFIQRGDRFSAAFDVAFAYNPRSTLVAVNRIAGITHAVLSPEAAEPDLLGNQSRVLSGLASVVHLGDEDYFIERGVAVFAQLGVAGGTVAAGSRAAALMTLRTALEDARDYAAHTAAFDERRRREYSVSRSDLEALAAVLGGERRLLVDVYRASDISAALRLAAEFGIELVVAGGSEAWLVAEELAAAGAPVILDSMTNLPAGFDRLNARLDSPALLAAAGVSFALGGNSANQNHNARNLRQAAGIAVANGLSWDRALRAVTLAPARIFGVDGRIGSLEPGKRADLVIWHGDPLELRSYPEQVFIGGRALPMESRQTLLRDRYLPEDATLPPAFRRR